VRGLTRIKKLDDCFGQGGRHRRCGLPTSLGSAGQEPPSKFPAACSRVLVRRRAIVAALLFLVYAFNVGTAFPREVMLTWFVITPIALCLSRAVRLLTR
jgi:hypothetical protein